MGLTHKPDEMGGRDGEGEVARARVAREVSRLVSTVMTALVTRLAFEAVWWLMRRVVGLVVVR